MHIKHLWTELSPLRKIFIQKQSKDILSPRAKVHLGFLLLIMYCSASHRNQIMHLDLQLAFCLLNYMPQLTHLCVYVCYVHVCRGTHVCLHMCVHPCGDHIQLTVVFLQESCILFCETGSLIHCGLCRVSRLSPASPKDSPVSQQWDFKYTPPHKTF